MSGYRVRVSENVHAFLTARSQALGISRELLIERLVERAFSIEVVGMPETPDDLWIHAMNTRPVEAGSLAIDGYRMQRVG